MGGKQIIRVEQSDSDLRFRDKVNRNFAALAQSTADERAAVDPNVVDSLIVAVNSKADQTDLDTHVASTQSDTVNLTSISVTAGSTLAGTVTFASAFAVAPTVVTTPFSPNATVSLSSVSTTGFGYVIRNTGSTTLTSLDFNWIAVM